jgi:hypothetical protein
MTLIGDLFKLLGTADEIVVDNYDGAEDGSEPLSNGEYLLIPELDFDLFKTLKIQKFNAVIAGGSCIRWYQGLPVKNHDIDLWFNSVTDRTAFIENLISNPSVQIEDEHETANAITYKIKFNKNKIYRIQTIKTLYKDIYSLIDNFDITVCKIATDGNTWFLGENTVKHIKNKKLVIDKPTEITPKRFMKYWAYGFEPDVETIELVKNIQNGQWDYSNAGLEDDYL